MHRSTSCFVCLFRLVFASGLCSVKAVKGYYTSGLCSVKAVKGYYSQNELNFQDNN